MTDRFGPWSSALTEGLSPHLSTFWKRRLELLGSARAARPALTRRDWLKLGVGGAAACALPTLHLASADVPDLARAPSTGRIYIQANFKIGGGQDDSLNGVFAVDPATASRTKVSDFNGRFRVSRDGRTLALSRSGWTGGDFHEIENVGLWTLDSEGKGEMRRIADFGGTTSFSPDSKQLIVTKGSSPKDDKRKHEIWRFNTDGSGATRLPIPETDEVDDWSSDGQWLVTVSDRHPPHGSGYQLYLMRPDGTDQSRLTEDRGLNVHPRFSPDSRRIAYLHQERGKNSLWVVNIDGSDRRQLFQEENDISPGEICWSPDGKSLAYTLMDWQRDEEGKKYIGDTEKSNPRIAIMDHDGKNSRPLKLPRVRWINSLDWS